METLLQFWPFGTSGVGLVVGGLVALLVVKFVAGMAIRLVSIGVIALGVGFWAFPDYMPFKLPFFGGSSEPKWVLVSGNADALGEDVAYSVSENPKMAVNGLPVCGKDNVGTVAVCGVPGFGVVAGMAASGLPTDLNMTSIPTGVCTYKSVTATDFVQDGGDNKVYQCRH